MNFASNMMNFVFKMMIFEYKRPRTRRMSRTSCCMTASCVPAFTTSAPWRLVRNITETSRISYSSRKHHGLRAQNDGFHTQNDAFSGSFITAVVITIKYVAVYTITQIQVSFYRNVMNFTLEMMEFVLKMMNFVRSRRSHQRTR